ncbi:bifunctional UDP-N-acetylglucosamine diphosphorylase/glucosamine-1-phosphate N-acetyltransferase GlmU [Numidum massiliense]|uniref:bifunctional UDP-N-acetylglucosamine diphosphorylase/glucosamine-1-phosphate N-acetyltransferase GlmU n=1 Tax=Numidum massiliense TaxID=1522315 RepID=UPI0006D54A75|nr:bifunctional UDP-N-acetylglucosamine diphosphorylase/glucosamine-1-phosphate N-acetyltransferase GlmU [Numidum massiliense]
MSHTYAVILAAGKGTRMKSKTHKVLHQIGGKPMVAHIVDTLAQLGVEDIVAVVGCGAEAVQAYLGNRVRYAVQQKQLGTAHAVMQTASLLEGKAGTTLVINGDNPLITVETYRAFLQRFAASGAAASMLTAIVDDSSGYGRVCRAANGDVERVVEHKDATTKERSIKEINTGTFCFDNAHLFAALKQVDNDNAQGEYYLPDVLQVLRSEGQSISAFCVDDASETVGINNRVQLAEAEAIFRARTLREHMANGVTVIDPANTYIEADVAIGMDTVIYPGTVLRGQTVIGEDCVIGPQADIRDCRIADRVTIENATLVESVVAEEATVGPYAYVRPQSDIGPRVKIGDFVEVKNAVVGADTKIPHLSYVGDAEIGQGVNVGCGAITVNYDGQNKWRTVVGDRAFIGCNANVIAPVHIGDGAYVAAGSTITADVPDDAFAIARERQTTKTEYARKLSEKVRKLSEKMRGNNSND